MASQYEEIADELRGRILEGTLGPDAKLPTEQELMTQWGASRNTVRTAIAALAYQGLIITRPGRNGGSFVQNRIRLTYYASREGAPGSEHTAEFDKIIRLQGAEPRQEFSLGIKKASAAIAERLLIPEGSTVVLRRLEKSADNEPVSIQDSYYPEDLARDPRDPAARTRIMEPESVDEGIVQELARLGHRQVGYRDELTSEMPSPEDVRVLKLSPGVPVIEHWRTGYSADRPIRVTRTLFAGDRNRLVYEYGDTGASSRHV